MMKYFTVDGKTFYYNLDTNIYFSDYNAIFANDKGEEDEEAYSFFIIKKSEIQRVQSACIATELITLGEPLIIDITGKAEFLSQKEFDKRVEQLKNDAIQQLRKQIDFVIRRVKKLQFPSNTDSIVLTGSYGNIFKTLSDKTYKVEDKKLIKYFEKERKELVQFMKNVNKDGTNDFYKCLSAYLEDKRKSKQSLFKDY